MVSKSFDECAWLINATGVPVAFGFPVASVDPLETLERFHKAIATAFYFSSF